MNNSYIESFKKIKVAGNLAAKTLDEVTAFIKPGVTTDKVAEVWPTAESLGFPSEDAAFGLQFGHGLGLALHERPIISRAISLEHPMEIKTGMVFALETYCPAKDGFQLLVLKKKWLLRIPVVRLFLYSRLKNFQSLTSISLIKISNRI